MAIDWGREINTTKTQSRYVEEIGLIMSPWLMAWVVEACERDIRKMTRAIERLGDGEYGFLQDELLYTSRELMELHGYITFLQIQTSKPPSNGKGTR